jgi:hypothetical protein
MICPLGLVLLLATISDPGMGENKMGNFRLRLLLQGWEFQRAFAIVVTRFK